MDKTSFRNKIEKIQEKNMATRLAVSELIKEFLDSRIIWYSKIERVGGNSIKQIQSDCNFAINCISAKFGDTLGIDSKTMLFRILRDVRSSKQRKSIRKSGKNRKTM